MQQLLQMFVNLFSWVWRHVEAHEGYACDQDTGQYQVEN